MGKFKDLDSILLVDDDKFVNLFHTKIIERSGLNVPVKAITNVKEALAFLTQSGCYENLDEVAKPSIIFLDINMPGLNGWDFLEQYNQLDDCYRAKIIVVMLTTSFDPEDHKRALSNRHVVDFLHKPLRPEALMRLLERHFELVEPNHLA
ncbi:response regulator [Spirosoma lituiforme]